VTDQFLTTHHGTMTSAPVSINLVDSPQEMATEVTSGRAITWAAVSSVPQLWSQALMWNHLPRLRRTGSEDACTRGEPIIADAAGKDLFIEVVCLEDAQGDKPRLWHVSVNNPTDKSVTTRIRKVMDLPGREPEEQTMTFCLG